MEKITIWFDTGAWHVERFNPSAVDLGDRYYFGLWASITDLIASLPPSVPLHMRNADMDGAKWAERKTR